MVDERYIVCGVGFTGKIDADTCIGALYAGHRYLAALGVVACCGVGLEAFYFAEVEGIL